MPIAFVDKRHSFVLCPCKDVIPSLQELHTCPASNAKLVRVPASAGDTIHD
jgi:hypothetical protein